MVTFGEANEAAKAGKRIQRVGWNGRNMWVRHIDLYFDKEFTVHEHNPSMGTWRPFLVMKAADNSLVPWVASQTDVLADDWSILV
jgi:hypothetical protein